MENFPTRHRRRCHQKFELQMLWLVGLCAITLATGQQHDEDGFLLNPETPFHKIGSWSVQQASSVYMEPFRFDYQVHTSRCTLKLKVIVNQ